MQPLSEDTQYDVIEALVNHAIKEVIVNVQ